MSTSVYVITGLDRVGKSTAAAMLPKSDKVVIECGAVVKEIVRSTDVRLVSTEYENRMEDFDRRIVLACEFEFQRQPKTLVIVGVRSFALLQALRKSVGPLIVVYIGADVEDRFTRHCVTTPASVRMSLEEFKANDLRQAAWGLEQISKEADFVVSNSKGLPEFQASIMEHAS